MKRKMNMFKLLWDKELMCLWDDIEDDYSSFGMRLDRLKKEIDGIQKLIKERKDMVESDFIKFANRESKQR